MGRTSTYQYQPTGADYSPGNGDLTLTIPSHNLVKGDRIKIATNSLVFTCAKDNHTTQHPYPRVGDPAEGTWHTVDAVVGDLVRINVGESVGDNYAHLFVSATATAVERAVVSYGIHKYNKFADAGYLLRKNQNFIATTAYGRMQADNPSFSGIYKTKCIRDTNLLIDAVADNVEFGGNDAVYDAANQYVGTVHLNGEEGESVQVFNHARDICRQVMRNLTVTTNSDTVGTQIKDTTISNDSGSTTYSEACCIDVASTITTLWGIVTQAVGTGAHTFVQSTAGNITVTGGGSGPFTAVAPTTYDNTTGLMEMEIGSHSLTTSDTVTIAANSMTFTCANDNNTSQKTYPRTSDPAYNTAVAITAVTATTITVNVGTNTGNLNGLTRTAGTTNEFQVEVQDVTFNGVDTTFTTLSGGSAQVLPASDNFLIFLNSTLQVKGTDKAYTYSGSQITFSEPPLAGMDFYGFYFGKLTQLDDIAPFFDNKKKTFTMKQNTEPFSLESDNAAVQAQNNLLIFINGVYQEPGVAYSLTGSIIEFSEPPRAGSSCILYIYTGSASDVLISNTFNAIDPDDRVQIASEGSDRRVATVSSSTTIDSYEFTGLRPNVAEFTATVTGGQVTQVIVTNQGSNYEVPPILIFQGGGGEGATAETIIETGSGRVLGVVNLKGGAGYTSAPNVLVVHPMTLERNKEIEFYLTPIYLHHLI